MSSSFVAEDCIILVAFIWWIFCVVAGGQSEQHRQYKNILSLSLVNI